MGAFCKSLKIDVLPGTYAQIVLTAKWLVRHSSTSPNQQPQPFTSLLSLSMFYVLNPQNYNMTE